jgi:heterodisulfide reductase subunit A
MIASITIPSLVARLDERLCSRCWQCLPACDAGALLRVVDDGLLLDPWACRGCGDCLRVCPDAALALAPRVVR